MREVPAMTKMSPLLERNEQFAATYTAGPLGPPAAQVVIVTCLDHRVDPAITLGLGLGDAVVIRNTGGPVTPPPIHALPPPPLPPPHPFTPHTAPAAPLQTPPL